MDYFSYQEHRKRGTFDFPIEFHYVDDRHPRYQMPLHWHVEYELILVLKGRLELRLNEEQVTVAEGDVLMVSSGMLHGGLAVGCVYECVVFNHEHFLRDRYHDTKLDNALLEQAQHVLPLHKKGSPFCEVADKLFETMESEYPGYELVTEGLLLQLYGTILRYHLYTEENESLYRSNKKLQPLKNALRLIRETYSQPLSLADLAGAAGMSPRYFCRYFLSMTERTPIEYLNYYRIEAACEQLSKTDYSITDIAMNCGFNDLSYFIKIFHRFKGISPKQFRQER